MGKHLRFYLDSSDFLDLFQSGLRPGLSTNTYSGLLVRLLRVDKHQTDILSRQTKSRL